jgi:hypothetical protein
MSSFNLNGDRWLTLTIEVGVWGAVPRPPTFLLEELL